jgi:tRNA A-37 threonylcarbamoyl transferase component Bud32
LGDPIGEKVALTVTSFPASEVYLETAAGPHFLGRSGAAFKFDPPVMLNERGEPAQFASGTLILKAPRHDDLRVDVGAQQWTAGRLPGKGAYRLPADSIWVTGRDYALFYPRLVATVVLVLAVGLGLAFRRKGVPATEDDLDVSGDPLVGRTLGDYTVEKRLGMGGGGAVYRVRDASGSYAAKVLYFEKSSERVLERFRREYELLSKVGHSVFPRVFDYRETESMAYLVMELVEGETLRESVHPGGRSWSEIAPWIEALVQGLGSAHEQGIVHRDLKPENIMLAGGQIKILDFGLARVAEGEAITRTGEAFGTPRYVAPEQVTATGTEADPRTDLYSLGIICYELLTGAVPFDGGDAQKIIAKHLQEDPQPLTSEHPLPPGVEEWVMRLLEKNISNRFPDCQRALEELQKIGSDDHLVTDETTAITRPGD